MYTDEIFIHYIYIYRVYIKHIYIYMASWKRPLWNLWKMYNFVFNGGLVKICPIAPSLVALIFNWKLGTRNLAFTNNHQHGSYKLFPTLYFQETTSNTHLYMHHVADLHVYKCISFWWQFKHYCRYTDIPNVPITYPVGIHRPTWPNRVGVVAKLVIMIIVMMVYRYNQQSMHKGKNLQGSFKN